MTTILAGHVARPVIVKNGGIMIKYGKGKGSYSDITKITPSAGSATDKNAYYALTQLHHPDQNPGNRKIAALKFRLLDRAYRTLRAKDRRLRYNRVITSHYTSPRALHLRADNDNRNKKNSVRKGPLSRLLAFFMPPPQQETDNGSSIER